MTNLIRWQWDPLELIPIPGVEYLFVLSSLVVWHESTWNGDAEHVLQWEKNGRECKEDCDDDPGPCREVIEVVDDSDIKHIIKCQYRNYCQECAECDIEPYWLSADAILESCMSAYHMPVCSDSISRINDISKCIDEHVGNVIPQCEYIDYIHNHRSVMEQHIIIEDSAIVILSSSGLGFSNDNVRIVLEYSNHQYKDDDGLREDVPPECI